MYKELMEERQKQIDLRAKKEREFESFSKATDRILEDIDKRIKESHEELTKQIKRHFSGVEVDVFHNEVQLYVQVNGSKVLTYTAKLFERENIKREISDKIVKEYNEHYGEVKELEFVPYEDYAPRIPYVGYYQEPIMKWNGKNLIEVK